MREDTSQREIKMVLERFADLVKKLTSTQGRLEKEAFLRQVADDYELLEVLKFLFNPYIVTGISDKKLNKHKKMEIAPDYDSGLMPIIGYFKNHNTGRDEDIKFLVAKATATQNPELVYSIIKRDLKLGIQNTTLNKVFGAGFVPKFDVMLAERFADNPNHVQDKDFIITEKLDGIRCILIFDPEPAFFSRSGQPILDLVELVDQVKHLPKNFVYDGELLLENTNNLKSEDLYRATVKVTNKDGEKKNILFNMFDMVDKECFKNGIDPTSCIDRKKHLKKTLENLHKKNIGLNLKLVPMLYVGNDINEISRLQDQFARDGGEGIMLNIANAPYECKRTKSLLKVKQFNTADVLVIDVEEGSGANRGRLGAVLVKFHGPDGEEYTVRVGSGFKLDEREKFWHDKDLILGKIIEIGYFELSRNQNDENYSMRFPTFKHVRHDKTEISMH